MKTLAVVLYAATLLWASIGEGVAQSLPFDCPAGGRLEQGPSNPADQPFTEQRAFDLIHQPNFAARHRTLVREEDFWVQELPGPSSPNRYYVYPGGQVLIFDSCKPRDCGDNKLYGATGNAEGYGLRILERQTPRDLGKLSPAGWAAIDCAYLMDEESARRTREVLRRRSNP